MSVLSFSRNSCMNIMCDTHISSIGYICGECQTEFKNYLSSNNITVDTESEITSELKKFMNTEKNNYDTEVKISVDDFFNDHTR